MATIHREIDIACPLDEAWMELRDFGSAARLFAGVLTDCRVEDGVRAVTFANGKVVRERLIAVDEDRRRLVYTVVDGAFSQHSAAMQMTASATGTRFLWTSDFLPDEVAGNIAPLVEAGCQAIKRALEGKAAA